MRRLPNHRKVITIFAVIIVFIFFAIKERHPTPTEKAIAITFQSLTSAPSSDQVFRLFSISNAAEYDVRWHGDWVEIDGKQDFQGRIVNSKLPGKTYTPVLKSGESFILNIGEPFYPNETGRWRFTMSFSRYDVKER